MTVGAGVLDLATLGTDLRLGGADNTRGERVHVHWQAGIRHRMDGQLRLDRVGSGIGGLINSVIVGVGTDGSHSWKRKKKEGGTVSGRERTDGGCGGREERMKGQRAIDVRAAKARGAMPCVPVVLRCQEDTFLKGGRPLALVEGGRGQDTRNQDRHRCESGGNPKSTNTTQ